jgi:hypothetical protein
VLQTAPYLRPGPNFHLISAVAIAQSAFPRCTLCQSSVSYMHSQKTTKKKKKKKKKKTSFLQGEELGTVSGSVGPFTIEPHGTVLLVLTLSSGGISTPTPPMSSPCSPSYPYPKFPYETKCRDVVPSMPQPCNSPDGPGSFSICW